MDSPVSVEDIRQRLARLNIGFFLYEKYWYAWFCRNNKKMGPCAMNKICLVTLTISYTFCSILNLRWKKFPYPDPGPGLFFFLFFYVSFLSCSEIFYRAMCFFVWINSDKPDYAKTLQGPLFCLFGPVVDVYLMLIFARNKIREISLIIDSRYIIIKIEKIEKYVVYNTDIWSDNFCIFI